MVAHTPVAAGGASGAAVTAAAASAGAGAAGGAPLQVRLRVAGGGQGEKDYTLTVSSADSVAALKLQLAGSNADGLVATKMRMFCAGRELSDDLTLDTARLVPDIVVQVYLRPK